MSPKRRRARNLQSAEPFEATRRMIATLLPAIDGVDAEGYLSDLTDTLNTVTGLAAVRVRKTPDPMRRYEAEARLGEPAGAVAEELLARWRRLAYPDEDHELAVAADRVVLEFVTWLPDRWHVTGRITASRA